LGSVNLHASLLPKYRGAAPINWAIINGEQVSGASVIRLAQKMDAGAILGQQHLPIGRLETAGSYHDRLAESGAKLLLRVVKELEEVTALEREQDESQATAAPKLKRDDARIDWYNPGLEIANRIRGLSPWPGCRIRVLREDREFDRLTLVSAATVNQTPPVQPFVEKIKTGQQFGVIQEDLTIGAGDAHVEIIKVQPEGKKPMTLAAYRNGHPWEPGMRVESL